MFRNKQQVDKHISGILSKLKDATERNLRGYQFAKLYLEVKDYENAKRFINYYLSIKGQYPNAFLVKGEILEGLGDKPGALEAYRQVYTLDPSQKSVIPKICELCCETGGLGREQMQFWVDLCTKHYPSHRVVFRLREQLHSNGTNGTSMNQEQLLLAEMKVHPEDDSLHVKYLNLLLDNGQASVAYKHATDIHNYFLRYYSLNWFVVIDKIFQTISQNKSLTQDSVFSKSQLMALDGLTRLSVAKHSLPDAEEILGRFDKAIVTYKSQLPKPLVRELVGLLYFHTANFLQRKLKTVESKEAISRGIYFCYSVCASIAPISVSSNETPELKINPPQTFSTFIRRESKLRSSIASHLVHQWASVAGGEFINFVQGEQDELTCLVYYDERKENEINGNHETGLSMLTKDNGVAEWALRYTIPFSKELRKQDLEVLCRDRSNLALVVWFFMQYDTPCRSIYNMPPEVGVFHFIHEVVQSLFPNLKEICADSPDDCEVTPESLCRLDLVVFLTISLRFCQSRRPNSMKQLTLPPTLCLSEWMPTKDQRSFWEVANGLIAPTGVQLGGQRNLLHRCLEQLRVGRVSLPLALHSAISLSSVMCQEGATTGTRANYWVEVLWSRALSRLNKQDKQESTRGRLFDNSSYMPSPQTISSGNRDLFPIDEEEELKQAGDEWENAWREHGVHLLSQLASDRGDLEASLSVLDNSRSAHSAHAQARMLMRLGGGEVAEPAVVDKAKRYLFDALDRLNEEKEPNKRQVLNDVILKDLEEVESIQQNSILETIPGLVSQQTPLSRRFLDSQANSTPGIESTRSPGLRACVTPHSRPTPERLDAQLRMLANSQERVISQLLEHNKSLQDANSNLNQVLLEANTKTAEANCRISQLSIDLDEARKICAELRQKLADKESSAVNQSKQQAQSQQQQQQQQQMAAVAAASIPAMYAVGSPYLNAVTNPALHAMQLAALQQQQQLNAAVLLQQQQQQRRPGQQLTPGMSPRPAANLVQLPLKQEPSSQHVTPGAAPRRVKAPSGNPEEECEEGDDEYYYMEDEYEQGDVCLTDGGWPYGQQQVVPSTSEAHVQPKVPVVSGASGKVLPAPGFFQSPGAASPQMKGTLSSTVDSTHPTDAFTIGSRPLLKQFEKSSVPQTPPRPQVPNVGNTMDSKPVSTTTPPVSTGGTTSGSKASPFAGISFNLSKPNATTTAFTATAPTSNKGLFSGCVPPEKSGFTAAVQSASNTSQNQGGGSLFTFGSKLPSTTASATPPKPLFGFGQGTQPPTKTPEKGIVVPSSPGAPGEGGNPEDFEPSVDFKPVIELPSIVSVQTGEENEKELFNERAQLYRYDKATKAWKTRGTGVMKILKHEITGNIRLIMRRDQVKKLCANHSLLPLMKLEKYSSVPNAYMWGAKDFSEEEAKDETFAARFKTEELANKFQKVFELAVKELQKPSGIAQKPPTVSSQQKQSTNQSLVDKFKPKPGAWECSGCYVENLATNAHCVACNTPNPSKSNVTAASIKDKFKAKPGEWSCTSCYLDNDASRDKCVACETPKSGTSVGATSASGDSTLRTLLGNPTKPASSIPFGGAPQSIFNLGPNTNASPQILFGAPPPSQQSSLSKPPTGFSFGSLAISQPADKAGDKPTGIIFGAPDKSANKAPAIVFGTTNNASTDNNSSPICFGAPMSTDKKNETDSTMTTDNSKKPITGTGGLFSNLDLTSKLPPTTSTKPLFSFGNAFAASNQSNSSSSQPPNFAFAPAQTTPPKTDAPCATTSATSPGTGDDELYVEDEGEHIYFKPVLETLPEKVAVVTGEEGETTIFTKRAKLFRWTNNMWKERGIGDMKLLKTSVDGIDRVRIMMRREQVLKVCCNHQITSNMELKAMRGSPGNAWTWYAFDFSEADEDASEAKQSPNLFAIRFKLSEDADTFKRHFDEAVSYKKTHKSPMKNNDNISISKEPKATSSSVEDDDIVFVKMDPVVSADQIKRARALQLPDCFYSFESLPKNEESEDPEEDKLLDEAVKRGIPRVSEPGSGVFGSFLKPASFTPNIKIVTPVATGGSGLFGSLTSTTTKPSLFSTPISTSSGSLFASTPTTTGGLLFGSVGAVSAFKPPATTGSSPSPSFSSNQHLNKPSSPFSAPTSNSAASTEDTTKPAEPVSFNFKTSMPDFAALAQNSTVEKPAFTASKVDFKWAGQGNKLFGESPSVDKQKENGDQSDDEDVGEAEPDIHFLPVIELPELVKVQTGEEGETCLFKRRAQLYRFTEGQWKERGIGEMKILCRPSSSQQNRVLRYRLIMRREQIFKLCCNHSITLDCPKFMPMSSCLKSTCWFAQDFSEEEAKQEKFAVRFKFPDDLAEFKSTVATIQKELADNPASTLDDCDVNGTKSTVNSETELADNSISRNVSSLKADDSTLSCSDHPESDEELCSRRVTLKIHSVASTEETDGTSKSFMGELSIVRTNETKQTHLKMTADSSKTVICLHQISNSLHVNRSKKTVHWTVNEERFDALFSSEPAAKEFVEQINTILKEL